MEPKEPPKASSHYAWNASTAQRQADLAALNVSTAPRLVSAGGAASPVPVSSPSAGASAWNSAGTWEEKTVTASATAALKDKLLALRPPRQGAFDVSLVRVATTGDVRLISTRGTLRVGFELDVSGGWEMRDADGAIAATGTFNIDEAADTDCDVFEVLRVSVTTTEKCSNGEAVSVVKLADASIRATFKSWIGALTGK
jgi:hypothetical protein